MIFAKKCEQKSKGSAMIKFFVALCVCINLALCANLDSSDLSVSSKAQSSQEQEIESLLMLFENDEILKVRSEQMYEKIGTLRDLGREAIAKLAQNQSSSALDSRTIEIYIHFLRTYLGGLGKIATINPLDMQNIEILAQQSKITPKELEHFKAQFRDAQERWISAFLSGGDEAKAKRASAYFTPVEGCGINEADGRNGGFCCEYSDGEKYCYYKALQPLSLRALIILENNYKLDSEAGIIGTASNMRILSYENASGVAFDARHIIPLDSSHTSLTKPKWLNEGLAGRIEYEVLMELQNAKVDMSEGYNCARCENVREVAISYGVDEGFGDEITLNVGNIKMLSVREVVENRTHYEDVARAGDYILRLKDKHTKLLKKPNGRAIATIEREESERLFVIGSAESNAESVGDLRESSADFGTDSSDFGENLRDSKADSSNLGATKNQADSSNSRNAEWVKMLYFPKDSYHAKDALIGYIHKNQFEMESKY